MPCTVTLRSVFSIKTAHFLSRLENRGGSVLLLSPTPLLCDDPTLPGSCQSPQFARRNFQEHLARCHILDHEGTFHTPATNITYLSFRFNQFIELPTAHPLGSPHLVL